MRGQGQGTIFYQGPPWGLSDGPRRGMVRPTIPTPLEGPMATTYAADYEETFTVPIPPDAAQRHFSDVDVIGRN